MAITVETTGKICVIKIEGVLDENLARRLRTHLKEISDSGVVYVIFNMSATRFVSSTGLGLMVSFTNEHQKHYGTGSVILAGVSEHIQRTMQVLGLIDLFVITATGEDAIKLCHQKFKGEG